MTYYGPYTTDTKDIFVCEYCEGEYPTHSHYNIKSLDAFRDITLCGYCNESIDITDLESRYEELSEDFG